MTPEAEKIIREATGMGACVLANRIHDLREAIYMLLSPQGREFAMRNGYPTAAVFRRNMEALGKIEGVYVDAGRRGVSGTHDIVAVGDTELTVHATGTARLHHIMAMHGARVHIRASNHAVVTATEAGGTIMIDNDGTAVIKIERP